HRRRAAEGLNGGHAVAHHQLELPRVVAMREDTDVAAVADGDARVERGAEARLLLANARRIRIDAAPPATIRENRVARRDSRTEIDALLSHHSNNLYRPVVNMFDGRDPGLDCPAHSLRGRGMPRDQPAR